jgi:hypothetical protein
VNNRGTKAKAGGIDRHGAEAEFAEETSPAALGNAKVEIEISALAIVRWASDT